MTKALKDFALIFYILIHTSVKLVTVSSVRVMTSASNFNPHEREARDSVPFTGCSDTKNFNPHEREARDRS